MKTISCIFTSEKVTDHVALANCKKYTYNSADLSVGDMVKSPQYSKNIQCVSVLEHTFSHINVRIGELVNVSEHADAAPSYLVALKVIKLAQQPEIPVPNVVYAELVSE